MLVPRCFNVKSSPFGPFHFPLTFVDCTGGGPLLDPEVPLFVPVTLYTPIALPLATAIRLPLGPKLTYSTGSLVLANDS